MKCLKIIDPSKFFSPYVQDLLESEQPAMCRSPCPIHDGISPGFDGSVPPFSRVLIPMVGFRLSIIDVVGP